jgi:hypothetical protein
MIRFEKTVVIILQNCSSLFISFVKYKHEEELQTILNFISIFRIYISHLFINKIRLFNLPLINYQMKKLYLLLIASSTSFAQFIPFTGTGLLTANGWTTHSGTAGQLSIITTPSDSGNSLSFPGLAASTGNRTAIAAGNSQDVNIALPTSLTGIVYYSALIKATESSTLYLNTSFGDNFLSLTSVASATSSLFQARLYVKQGTLANTINIGILNNSGGTGAVATWHPTNIDINTTNLMVVKYDLATNTASLFVNPVPGASEPATTLINSGGTSAAPSQIAGFVIREAGSATAGTGNIEIDEIRVGSTFASVTPATLGVKSNDIAGLNIYPNPVTNGTLFINTDANAERNATVFDVLGKQVLKVTTSNNAINVANLNAGVYIVKVTEEGKTATRKLVIR